MKLRFSALLLLACLPSQLMAATLEYSVEGVRGKLKKNIHAWLGAEPATAPERSNFIASAEARVARSLKALGYYRPAIVIELDKQQSPWQMLVRVTANEPVRIAGAEILVSGEAETDPEFNRLISAHPLVRDKIFNHGEYEEFKRQLLALGQRRGYFDAVTPVSRVEVDAAELTARVTLHYDSGPRYRFGELDLDESVMDMSWTDAVLTFREGDFFDLKVLQRLRGDLQQTKYFSSVIVRPQLQQLAAGRVPVSVQVFPAKRHNFDFGLGYSTDTEERLSVTWRTPLLNRYGHSQETRLEYSPINPGGRFAYNIPLSHPLNDVLQLSAYLEDKEYGGLDSTQKGVRVSREIRSGQWIASYALRTLDESWAEVGDHKNNSYVLPGFSLSHKTRVGSLVDPEAGFQQLYLVEGGHEDAGSDVDMLRAYGNFRFVRTLAPRHRLVARAELGAVFISDGDRKNLAPSLSFFAGGSQSIRGYNYQSIGNVILVEGVDGSSRNLVVGGDRLATASLEYQYYFTDTWRGALFIDGGDAFDEGEFEAHYGAGFGIHYMSPVGAIRLELAHDFSEDNPSWRLHINVGAEF